jgi:hypothetical protein
VMRDTRRRSAARAGPAMADDGSACTT